MRPLFSVQTSPHFERLVKRLRKQHRELPELLSEAIEILETDPYNRTQQHTIKKLSGSQVDGQYRLRIGRWRFRYDIVGQSVELKYCGLRREDTYRS
jgi:mRNA-degrading endonuclease RelE of RelBE toxin-antitoxin system